MPTDSGYSNQKMRGPSRHQTLQTMGSDRVGIPTAQMYLYEKTPVAIEITSVEKLGTDNLARILVIEFDGPHLAKKYDIMRMLDNVLEGWEFEIIKVVDATTIHVYNIGDLEGVEQLPEVGDTVKTLRWTTALSDPSGALQVSQGPLQFVRDAVTTQVNEDTAVPANNKPLPAGMYILKDGVAYPVEDSATPADVVAVPVKIMAVDGTNINITAGDIDVQLSDMGVNFDATRIGDGSGVYLKIEADGSITSTDPSAVIELQNIVAELGDLNAKDFATEATQELNRLQLVALNGKDFATQTTLAALLTAFNAEDFASQTTLAALLTAFNAEDFATQTTLAAVLAAIGVTNAKDFATETTLAALSAKFGSLGQKASAGSAPVVLSAAQEAILSSLDTKLTTLITSNAVRSIDSMTNVAATNATVAAPANAKGFIIQNSTNANGGLRFTKQGGGASATVGYYLGVGQSTSYIDGASNLALFDAEAVGFDACIIWFI